VSPAERLKKEKLRGDGRTDQQIRPIQIEQGLLNRADGSVRFSQGKTSVLIGVYGPIQVPTRKEKIDRATVEVIWKPISGQKTNFDVEKASLVRQSLESIILVHLHPRTLISVIVQVIQDDGALLASAITGSWIALVDAGIQCKANLSAVTITALSFVKEKSDEEKKKAIEEKEKKVDQLKIQRKVEWRYLIDPTKEEEECGHCTVTLAFNSVDEGFVTSDTRGVFSSSFVLDKTPEGKFTLAESEPKPLEQRNSLAEEEDSEKIYFECYNRAHVCCKHIFHFVTTSFKEKLRVLQ